jgi:hypothetical protein
MGYETCDSADVEAINGVFKPIRSVLGVTAFGINEETLPPNGDAYPDHDHAEDGQEEVFYVLVSADAKRKIFPGDEGLRLIIVGSPPGAYAPRQG